MLDNSFMPYGKKHFKDAKLAFFLRACSICWFKNKLIFFAEPNDKFVA